MATRIPLKLCLFDLIDAYHVQKSNTNDNKHSKEEEEECQSIKVGNV